VEKVRPRRKVEQDKEVLDAFIRVFCSKSHGRPTGALCEGCSELRGYAMTRLEKCPYDPKPKCKECKTHCYQPVRRKEIQEVMRVSGMHFVKRGRLDWLWKYFF
jgi:hypothetical protein